ncbi:MAG: RNA polymerase sigma factor [Bacteroidota bacterium]
MSTEKLDDFALVNLFQQDKSQVEFVFSALLKRHNQVLYWHIRRMTKNHEETNDILQNVWMKVWRHLNDFKNESSFYTWIYRISRNETINFLEKEKKHRSVEVDEAYIEILAGHEGLQNFSADQIVEKLQQAIETLPEKQALVFQLKFYEDLKYSEISEKLNTSEGALKASYHHAVKKIQEFLHLQLNLFNS